MSPALIIAQFTGSYSFLSNFHLSPLEYQGKKWLTVEHAYQAAKTKLETEKQLIMQAESPGRAKRLGQKVTVRPDWEQIKVAVMLELLRLKFQFSPLRLKLSETKDWELVEGNYWNDTFWGVCRGVGQNQLGKLLMQVRQEIHTANGGAARG